MKDEKTLGQKIRDFRKRADISQFDLEVKINASPGSLSRIESGQINPTKETLVKIIEALDLKTFEAGSLFDLDFDELPKMVELARKLSSSLDLDQVLQNAVNEITFELGLLAASIFLINEEQNRIYSITFTQSWFTRLVMNIIKVPYSTIYLDITNGSDNLIIKSVLNKKEYTSNDLFDFAIGTFNKSTIRLLEKVINHGSAMIIPIVVENKSIGAVLFSKSHEDKFEKEYKILKAFTENIGSAITNAQKYKMLQNEILILKNGR